MWLISYEPYLIEIGRHRLARHFRRARPRTSQKILKLTVRLFPDRYRMFFPTKASP